MYRILLLSQFVLISVAILAPKLQPIAIPKDLVQGTEYRLTCLVSVGDTPLEIEWFHNFRRFHGSSSVIKSDTSHTSTLTFKSLKSEHSGTYKCVAYNAAGNDSSSDELIVNIAPHWVGEPKDLNVELSHRANLLCEVDGSPKPSITWSRLDGLHKAVRGRMESNGTLVIDEVSRHDTGIYVCSATNGIGQPIQKEIRLAVYQTAHAHVGAQYLTIELGGSTNLTCTASGDHPLTVEWAKDDKILDVGSNVVDDRMAILSRRTGNDEVISSLVIKDARISDAGRYDCRALNSHGNHSTNVRLAVLQPPTTPIGLEVLDVWSRSARVRWKAPVGGSAPVQNHLLQYWSHRDDKRHNVTLPGPSTTALVRHLYPATEYKIQLRAVNGVGPSEPSQVVSFRTSDEEPSAPPSGVRVETTGARHVIITWSPPPESHWNGQLLGYYIGYRAASNVPLQGGAVTYSYHTVSPDDTTFTLRGLQKATLYGAIVRAYNTLGWGPPSEEVTFLTQSGNFPPPPMLNLAGLTADSVTLRWSMSSEYRLSGFTVYYRAIRDSMWRQVFLSNPQETSYRLAGLEPQTTYEIYLIAHSLQGDSEPSDVLHVRPTTSGGQSGLNMVAGAAVGGSTVGGMSPGNVHSKEAEEQQIRELLYLLIPTVSIVLVVVILLVAGVFYWQISKSPIAPPPPVNADYDFCFGPMGATMGMAGRIPGGPAATLIATSQNPYATYSRTLARATIKKIPSASSTPYSTMPRSDRTGSERTYDAIYESIADIRTLKRRERAQRAAAANANTYSPLPFGELPDANKTLKRPALYHV